MTANGIKEIANATEKIAHYEDLIKKSYEQIENHKNDLDSYAPTPIYDMHDNGASMAHILKANIEYAEKCIKEQKTYIETIKSNELILANKALKAGVSPEEYLEKEKKEKEEKLLKRKYKRYLKEIEELKKELAKKQKWIEEYKKR